MTQFQKKLLESKLEDDISPKYRQRIRIMLLADSGKSQSEIANILGCSSVTVRHWTLIARNGESHNWQDSAIGRPKDVTDQYLDRLKELVQQGPRSVKIPNQEYKYLQHRWTAPLLSQHLFAELGIEISARHINRLLKRMGLSVKSGERYNQHSSERVSTSDQIQIRDLNGKTAPPSVPTWFLGSSTISGGNLACGATYSPDPLPNSQSSIRA